MKKQDIKEKRATVKKKIGEAIGMLLFTTFWVTFFIAGF